MRAIVATVGLLLLAAQRPVSGQSRLPTDGGTTTSLGQPGPWLWTVGGAAGFGTEKGLVDGMGEARVGVSREILSRALGIGGLQGELYNQSLNAKYHAGVRLRWVSQLTGVAVGADYSLREHELRPIITYVHPGKRGGLFGDGSVARLDVVIGPRRSVTLGIEKPMFRRIPMGTTRPRDDVVTLPNAPRRASTLVPAVPALRDALATARDAARNIQRLCVPWLDHRGSGGARSDAAVLSRLEELRRLTSATGANRNIDSETRRFHDAVDAAFAVASTPVNLLGTVATTSLEDDSARRGRLVGERARAILLDEVILPYNRLLGQVKEKDSTLGYQVLARGAFVRWLHVESGLPATTTESVLSVFEAVLEMVEESRAISRREWDASRFVWLPLQYGLRAEQHDTQMELDAVVERATRREFTDGNSVSYVINEQFQNELARTIRGARTYHVLWTHDFRGHDAKGEPDEVSHGHVLHYLAALTARVRAYDSAGTLPVFLILLDEWFYEVNDGRLWMDLLEDPTRHRVRLGVRHAGMEASLRAAQDSLRAAIASSALLRSQRAQYGEAWLRNLVKVHVNITNATDPSFWSWHAVRGFPLPDTWMRDHRKLVFYDVSEADPSRGEAILTGAGIGEHYANAAWEDRSILVRGPAILPLKAAAREALIQQGIHVDSIPAVLQPTTAAREHDASDGQRGGAGERLRAMQLMNGTGFDAKQVNVAKAVLYTLMPAGSVIKIPDSLWNSTFWGSALVGCALRGVRVVVIAPSLENAPARAFGSMVRSRELLWRMVMASRVLDAEISSTGGLLKVGIYASTLPITDITGRLRATSRAMAGHAWLRDLFRFPASMYAALDSLPTLLERATVEPGEANGFPDFTGGSRPLLHLKANFFASHEAWGVMERPEWAQVTSAFMRQRIAQLNRRPQAFDSLAERPDSALRGSDDAVRRWYEEMLPATRERVLFYTVLGSANQNDRSMVSDGEDALVLAGWPAVIPYLDFLTLVGQSEWIETPEQLHALIPRQGRLQTMLAHWFKFVF